MQPVPRSVFRDPRAAAGGAPGLAPWLVGALFLGAVAVLSLPAARAHSDALGWMPLWLLGMPLASLAALAAARLQSLRLPRRRMPDSSPAMRRRRPGTAVQARRRRDAAPRPARAVA